MKFRLLELTLPDNLNPKVETEAETPSPKACLTMFVGSVTWARTAVGY